MNLFVENVTYVTSDVNIRDIHKLIKVQIVLWFRLRYDRWFSFKFNLCVLFLSASFNLHLLMISVRKVSPILQSSLKWSCWKRTRERERVREFMRVKQSCTGPQCALIWFWTIAHHHWGSDIYLVYKMRCIIVEQFGMLTASMRMNCKCPFDDLKSSAGLCVVFIVSCLLSHTAITIPNTLIPSDSIYFVFYSLSHIIFLVCLALSFFF